MTLFHKNGHLTDAALTALLQESLDETSRLEVAEHLSFCDTCLVRYTEMLDDSVLIEPEKPLVDGILSKIRQKVIRVFFNRYATAAAAIALAMIFWGYGIFDIEYSAKPPREITQQVPVSIQVNTFFKSAREGLHQGLIDLWEAIPSTTTNTN